jgi:hypothetical protein
MISLDRRTGHNGRCEHIDEQERASRICIQEVTEMPGSTVTVPHQLGKDEALRRIKGMLDEAQNKGGGRISDLQETWAGDTGTYSFKASGFKVSGSIEVRDTDVEIDIDYPMAARPFKSTIESTLRDRTEALLAA